MRFCIKCGVRALHGAEPNLPSQKRPGTSARLYTPLPKWPRRSARVTTEKAKGAEETSARSGSYGQTPYHAYPRHYRDKDWRVEDLSGCLVGRGWVCTVCCTMGTISGIRDLCEALRGVQLFKEKYGVEVWEKRLEMQGRLINLPQQRK